MTGPPVRNWDSVAFLDPRVETRDGHHGHAITAALREVMAETFGHPRDQHRTAHKKLVIGPGTLVTPPGGLELQSIRYLDIELDHTTIVGRGHIPAVLAVDGSSYGRIGGTGTIQGERAAGGRRLDVPDDVVVIRKSIEGHHAPNQTHFRFNAKIGGLWRNAGFRGGLPARTTAQEDHFKSDEIQVYGNYEVLGAPGEADLCKSGCGRATRRGPTIGVTSMDTSTSRGARRRCAKLDAWRPGLGGVAEKYNRTACAVWGSRGNCILDNVTVGSLPVKRGADRRLYYAPPRPDGTPMLTKLPAPRFWSVQPQANILTRNCSAHGYHATTGRNEFFAFEPEGHGVGRHELWKNTEPDGMCLGTELTTIDHAM